MVDLWTELLPLIKSSNDSLESPQTGMKCVYTKDSMWDKELALTKLSAMVVYVSLCGLEGKRRCALVCVRSEMWAYGLLGEKMQIAPCVWRMVPKK